MTFLRVITILTAVLIVLELIDPGIVSTAVPVLLLVALLLIQLVRYGKGEEPYSRTTQIVLTAMLSLTTMALTTVFARGGGVLTLATIFATTLAVAIVTWTVTQKSYANH